MDMDNDMYSITEENVAAWLDGNLSAEADACFADLLATDGMLAEILDACEDVEEEYEELTESGYDMAPDIDEEFELPEIGDPYGPMPQSEIEDNVEEDDEEVDDGEYERDGGEFEIF